MIVSLVQAESAANVAGDNLSVIETAAEKAAGDLLIFPELFLSGYTTDLEIKSRAERNLERWRSELLRIAEEHGKWIMTGAPYPGDDGLKNIIWVIPPEGKDIRYEKIHLAHFGIFREADVFTPGREPMILDINGFRFGLSICYDLFFPEMYRYYALRGADVLICASASPLSSQEHFERVLPARAVENTCYMLFVNNVGVQGDFHFFGGSRAISPYGNEIVNCGDSRYNIIEIKLLRDELERAREERPTLRDHRHDINWSGYS